MTTLTAIKGKDFVVMASDSQITEGNLKIPFPYQKISREGSNLISGSGSVGYCQMMLKMAIRSIKASKAYIDDDSEVSFTELNRNLSELNFSLPLEHKHFNAFGFITAGLEGGEPCIALIGSDGSLIGVPTFCSEGSGSDFAYSILSKGYKDDLTLEEAVSLIEEALKQSNKLDCYTNNKTQIVSLRILGKDKEGLRKWEIKDYGEPEEETKKE